ncbi:MT-A70-domain-containing protein [Xylaria nigripes]|nr:MT-A70-domain-containing protein [Xylaria nigripes]
MRSSSVLFKSTDSTVVVIDIPRSIEEAQVLPGQSITRRIISTDPIEKPWPVPDPKKETSNSCISPSAAIAELMTLESVKAALETVRVSHDGPWCLPRVTRAQTGPANAAPSHKQKRKRSAIKDGKEASAIDPFIPEQSHPISGTVQSQREAFLRTSPRFDLIVLDPPWPSRSVKRKTDSYTTVYNVEDARRLLLQIPITSRLKRNGLVAIWITNKAAILDLLVAPGGVFAQWDLEPIGEWTWVKVTSAGEPVLDVNSTWRKPWERLLIARERGSLISVPSAKVMLGVPDIHSRKPNLRGLFEEILPEGYLGLEVFARNLTAGWWGWGNEVFFFQQQHHWVAVPEKGEEISPS